MCTRAAKGSSHLQSLACTVQIVQGLNAQLGTDAFVAANAHASMDFLSNPRKYGKLNIHHVLQTIHFSLNIVSVSELQNDVVFVGFVTSRVACCGQGPYNGVGLCTPLSNLCSNRDVYAFWDPFHPSERANRLIVQTMMAGSSKYMNPMNLSTIMAMDSRN
ncbi:hypothetical protein ACLB2K_019841 [Fragaria x ananassa]